MLGYSQEASEGCVFFTVGLRFALRGVQEQHDLKLEQLKRYPPNTTEYSGDTYIL